MEGFLVGIPILLVLGLLVLGVLSTVFWIWMLIDCLTDQEASNSHKILWAMVILWSHFFGALLYLFFGRLTRNNSFA